MRSAISLTEVGGRSRAARATAALGPRSRLASTPSCRVHGRAPAARERGLTCSVPAVGSAAEPGRAAVYDGPGRRPAIVPALLAGRPTPRGCRSPCTTRARSCCSSSTGSAGTRSSRTPTASPRCTASPAARSRRSLPSTTAAALTSITTGLAPSEHGLVGYRVRVDGAVAQRALVAVANGRSRPPDPVDVQRHAPFLGRPVPVVTKSEFRSERVHRGAPARHALLRLARVVERWSSTCRLLVAAGEQFVYAYYPGVDEVAHAHGLHDGFYAAELAAADRLVGDLLDGPARRAPRCSSPPTTVRCTSDPRAGSRCDRSTGLVDACSGDGRFRYLHARRGAAAELFDAAGSQHGDHAWVARQRRAARRAAGSGPRLRRPPVRRARRRRARRPGPGGLRRPGAARRRPGCVSAHGSLTAAEMLVPLVAARGAPDRAGSDTTPVRSLGVRSSGRRAYTRVVHPQAWATGPVEKAPVDRSRESGSVVWMRGEHVVRPPAPAHRVLDARRCGPGLRRRRHRRGRRPARGRHHRPREHVRRPRLLPAGARRRHQARSSGRRPTSSRRAASSARAGPTHDIFHLTLLAENNAGYHNLIKVSSGAYLDGFLYKPRVDFDLLEQHREGLIGTSGCLGQRGVPGAARRRLRRRARRSPARFQRRARTRLVLHRAPGPRPRRPAPREPAPAAHRPRARRCRCWPPTTATTRTARTPRRTTRCCACRPARTLRRPEPLPVRGRGVLPEDGGGDAPPLRATTRRRATTRC